ncbi:helix-turn-helix domain-containing protein [Streptomyces sp. HMX87]|uniref:helix-turn-helix domain-containing protein n=1 Tax=Streptomyces sp. HMX87 TaxID=3390849 RepID=UPI003A889C9F
MTRSPATPLPSPKARRRLREAASLTRAQVAERVGVTRATVREWETGRSTPRGRKREAYAKLLSALESRTEVAGPTEATEAPGVAGATGTAGVKGSQKAAPGVTPEGAPDVAPTTAPDVAAEFGPAAVSAGAAVPVAVGGESAAGGTPDPAAPGEPASAEPPSAGSPSTESPSTESPSTESPSSGHISAGHTSDPPAGTGVLATETATDETGAEPEARPAPADLTPAQAFDALYAFCAPSLVRQAYLLTGRRELARESVERAFQRAWERWPEVARDRDPAGWVRAAAYEYAVSPWHRFRLRYRHPEAPPAEAADRVLMDVLLELPPPRRRALVLYDGVGLDLPDTAAETEATTAATAHRLMSARKAVAARLPELADPQELHRRLAALASTERLRAAQPPAVRAGSERRARFWTRAAIAFTAALIGTTALTLHTAPTAYEPPVPAGETVRGVPPRQAPGPLSDEELELRSKLRDDLQSGTQRLVPQAR